MDTIDSGRPKADPGGVVNLLYVLLLVSLVVNVVVILMYLLRIATGFSLVEFKISGSPFLAAVVAILYSFGNWILIQLISDVRHHRPFQIKNVKRIRLLAWAALGYLVFSFFRSSVVMTAAGLSFKGTILASPSPALIGALCLFAIAEVFKHGLVLRQEQDLTV